MNMLLVLKFERYLGVWLPFNFEKKKNALYLNAAISAFSFELRLKVGTVISVL